MFCAQEKLHLLPLAQKPYSGDLSSIVSLQILVLSIVFLIFMLRFWLSSNPPYLQFLYLIIIFSICIYILLCEDLVVV